MSVHGIIFDCYHTVIDLRFERLPIVDLATGGVTSSAGVLCDVLRAADHAAELESVHHALVDTWQRSEAIRRERRVETAARVRMGWLLEQLQIPGSESLTEQLCAAHARTLIAAMELMPHAREVLGGLAARVPLAMVSNFDRTQTVLDSLDHFGIRHFFEPVLVSDSEGIIKPDPDIFLRAAALMQLDPASILVVGDQPHADIAGARAAGMQAAWLAVRPEQAADVPASVPHLTSLRDLPALLN